MLSAGAAAEFVASENFKVVAYTGNGISRNIELGFQPDLVWIKSRSVARNHYWYDSTRGVNDQLLSNTNQAEATNADRMTAFNATSFTAGDSSEVNNLDETYVAYCWKAGGGTTSSNSDGTNITSTVQANTDAGFSIVKWTGDGNASSTVGHGLSAAPNMVISKDLSATADWQVYSSGAGSSKKYGGHINTAAAFNTSAGTNGAWNTPTSTALTFSNGSSTINNLNKSSSNIIAYCFTDITGFSKTGGYTGNGSTNGPIIETGFEVGWLMIKCTSDSSTSWRIYDNKRNTANPRNNHLKANAEDVEETTANQVDFLSNGFQLVGSNTDINGNNRTHVYIAFATDPDEEAPTLADSFNIETYTGTGSNKSIAGYGFAPNFLWIKQRSGTEQHYAYDTIRGYSKYLHPNLANAEGTDTSSRLASFDSDGFSLFTDAAVNGSGSTYVAWGWKANDDVPTIEEVTEDADSIAIYKFEDDVDDVTGNYDLTANSITYATGKFNKSAVFNGSSSYAQITSSAPQDSSGVMSVSFWAKTTSTSRAAFFIAEGPSTAREFLKLENYGYQGTNSFRISYNNSMLSNIDNEAISDGNWHHIVITAGNGNVKTYKDNVLLATQSVTITDRTLDHFAIGYRKYNNDLYFDGEIDQFRIFNKELNAASVTNLYNETAAQNDTLNIGTKQSNSIEAIVSVNANAGFSIVKATFAGEGVIPHGLSSTPEMVILKGVSAAEDWQVYHTSLGTGKYLKLNTTAAVATRADSFSSVNATSVTNNWTSGSVEWIMYCFHSVSGYSAFGTYTGSGSAGNAQNVGFKPDFLMFRRYNNSDNWVIVDTRRTEDKYLLADTTNTDQSLDILDFTSTGWTFKGSSMNNSSDTYIYAAFKKNVASNTTLADSFKTVIYDGNGASNRQITGVGFKPDLVWIKRRSASRDHYLFDSVRGTAGLYANLTNAEFTATVNDFNSFDSDGFTVGQDNNTNSNNNTMVAWCWKAGNTWQHNITGDINSTVNANTANGFSIVKYTATGGSVKTIGHGLSSAPELIIAKVTNQSYDWLVYHTSLGNDVGLQLHSNAAAADNNFMNDTSPTSSVFTAKNGNNLNYADGNEIIAYCFHSVTGFSKFGTYSGSGSNGNAVTLGFKPDFVIVKRTSDTGGWLMFDSVRSTGNPVDDRLEANNDQAEQTDSGDKWVTFNSNDFEANGSDTELNASGSTYMYAAWKMNPTVNSTLANSFKTVTYEGTGAAKSITGVGFKPDLIWLKNQDATTYYNAIDSVRGPLKYVPLNDTTDYEQTTENTVTSFDEDGFSVGGQNGFGNDGNTFVAWCWKAGNAYISNNSGSLGSIVSANTANGFSIVSYTGNGTNGATVGHGLSSTPNVIMVRKLDADAAFAVYHSSNTANPETERLKIDTNDATADTADYFNDTAPTSSVFTIGTEAAVNTDGGRYIAYCWHAVTGFSSFGGYTGNATAGTNITVGFQPDFVLTKRTDSADNWRLYDSVRRSSQAFDMPAYPNDASEAITANATGVSGATSTTFTLGNGNLSNASGATYVYMAFKHN